MSINKEEIFIRIKQEVQSAALYRKDNSTLYIFLKEKDADSEKHNFLIYEGSGIRKSHYDFIDKNDTCFLKIDGMVYEIIIPAKISDEESFTLTIKDTQGNLIQFENYI